MNKTPREIINKILSLVGLDINLNNEKILDIPVDYIIDDDLLEEGQPISLVDNSTYDVIIWMINDDIIITILKTVLSEIQDEYVVQEYIDIYPKYTGNNWIKCNT